MLNFLATQRLLDVFLALPVQGRGVVVFCALVSCINPPSQWLEGERTGVSPRSAAPSVSGHSSVIQCAQKYLESLISDKMID